MKFTTIAALLCAGAVGGCGSSAQLIGVPPSLQQSNLQSERILQNQMVDALVEKAGLKYSDIERDPKKWRDVADAGLLEVDIQCDRYLAALFTFNREQRAGRQILTAAGAATAAIMGLTGAAGATVALVAAAFGLAANVFDAGANSVLFTVSPVAIRAVAVRGRQAFLRSIEWERVTSRPRMMIVVQGYLAQCTPAAIEANIDNAATGAPSVSNIDTAIKAAALASPSSSILQDPTTFITSPTAGPTNNPLPASDKPVNLTTREAAAFLSKAEAMKVQSALGTTADADFGPAGRTPPGPTRLAISEYNAGLRARGLPGTGDVMDGNIPAYTNLSTRGPLSTSGVKSPFERALLGDNPTCFRIREVIDAVAPTGPAIVETDAQKCMTILRDAIAKRRTDLNLPQPAGVLDSKLYDRRPVIPPIPAPPPGP